MSNLRTHYSKKADHAEEWKRFLSLEAKAKQESTFNTPAKKKFFKL